MKFVKGPITHEQMLDVMKGKNRNLEGAAPGVFTVRIDNHHMYSDKNIYQMYPEIVPISCIAIDPDTEDWVFVTENEEVYDLPVYLTMEEAIADVKERSKFWETSGFNDVIGWSAPEAAVVQMKSEIKSSSEVAQKVKESISVDIYVEAFKDFKDATKSLPEPYTEFTKKLETEVSKFIMGI